METLIRKKDLTSVFQMVSSVVGPFTFCDAEGKVLYGSEATGIPSEKDRAEISLGGKVIGYISGIVVNQRAVAALIEFTLKNIAEKKGVLNHTLQKYKELSFLSQINAILGSSTDIDEVLCTATNKIHEIIPVESCSVLLADSKTGGLLLKSLSGRAVNEFIGLKAGEGIVGKVLTTGMPAIVNNPDDYHEFSRRGNETVTTLLCLPLKVKDVVIGVLNLRNKAGGFTTEDEALLTSVCVVIAEVIENHRLLAEKIRTEKFSAVGQMAAGIIHDIKNPMTTIKGFAGLLGDMEFSKEERKEYSSMITSEVDRLIAMIEDLLSFARGSKTALAIESLNVEDFFSDVLASLGKDMSVRNIDLMVVFSYKDVIEIDPQRFKRVIFNIAGNAREAMHNGGKFLILVREAPEGVELVFSDTGTGIPPAIIDTVFEPFITKGKKSGTGLGLAVSRKIVEEHGGTIKAVNGNYSGLEGFDGATFAILLPIHRCTES